MKRLFYLFFVLSLIIGGNARAEKSYDSSSEIPYYAEKYDYFIQSYDVLLTAETDRSVNVQEVITVYFNNPDTKSIKHIIPKYHGRISDVQVSVPYKENNGLGKLQLRVLVNDEQKNALKQYKVSYNYQIFSDENAFDFKIVPPEWKVPVQRVRFKLQLPDSVKNKDIHLFIDKKEIKNATEGAEYLLKEDRIIGRTTSDGLKPKQTFRIRVDVADGFFINNGKDYASYVWIGLLLLTLISFFLWCAYSQDDRVPAIVSQNPPRGINAAEAEIIHSGNLSEKGLTAMIISLANKGYLAINTIGKNFTLVKIKNYTGRNRFVKQIMHMLFADKDIAESSDLKSSGRFYAKWNQLLDLSKDPETLRRFYKKSGAQYLRRAIMLGCVIGNFLLTLFVMRDYMISEGYMLIAALVLISGFIGIKLFHRKNNLVFKIIGGLFLSYAIGLLCLSYSPDIQKEDMLQIIIGIGCTIISLVCFLQMPTPNAIGRLYRGQMFGLKNFIKFADKESMEKTLRSNPSYFYKVLPYAFVLGLNGEWLKLFEGVEIPIPTWAENDNFKIKNFMRNFPSGVTNVLEASSLCEDEQPAEKE